MSLWSLVKQIATPDLLGSLHYVRGIAKDTGKKKDNGEG
jgi:hypothetical protein